MKTLYYNFLYLLLRILLNPYYTLVTSILFSLLLRVIFSPDIIYAAGEDIISDKEGNIVERNPEKDTIIISKEKGDTMIEDTKPRSGNVRYPAFIEKIASFLLSEPIASAHETTTSSSDAHSETGTYSSDASSEADSNSEKSTPIPTTEKSTLVQDTEKSTSVQDSNDSDSEKSTHLENDQESMAPTTQTQKDLDDSGTQPPEYLDPEQIIQNVCNLIDGCKSKTELVANSLAYVQQIIPEDFWVHSTADLTNPETAAALYNYIDEFQGIVYAEFQGSVYADGVSFTEFQGSVYADGVSFTDYVALKVYTTALVTNQLCNAQGETDPVMIELAFLSTLELSMNETALPILYQKLDEA